MKIISTSTLFFAICFIAFASNAQTASNCGNTNTAQNFKPQKIGVVISSNDPETVWNAFRIANYSAEQGDTVSVFLLGKGVESPTIVNKDFDINEMMEAYITTGGKIFACGTCLQIRNTEGSKYCPVSTLQDLYIIIKQSEILLTF